MKKETSIKSIKLSLLLFVLSFAVYWIGYYLKSKLMFYLLVALVFFGFFLFIFVGFYPLMLNYILANSVEKSPMLKPFRNGPEKFLIFEDEEKDNNK